MRRHDKGPRLRGLVAMLVLLGGVGVVSVRPAPPKLTVTHTLDARYEAWRAHYRARGVLIGCIGLSQA